MQVRRGRVDRTGVLQRFVSEELFCVVGVEAHVLGAFENLCLRLNNGLSHFDDQHCGEVLDFGLHDVGGLLHPDCTLGVAGLLQGLKSLLCFLHSRFHLISGVFVEGLHGLAGGGVDYCDGHGVSLFVVGVGGGKNLRVSLKVHPCSANVYGDDLFSKLQVAIT